MVKSQIVETVIVLTSFLAIACTRMDAAETPNLLLNSSFEEADADNPSIPANWTADTPNAVPLEFTDAAYSGVRAGKLVAGDEHHMWRQDVIAPQQREWTLSGWVRAEGGDFWQGRLCSALCARYLRTPAVQHGDPFLGGHPTRHLRLEAVLCERNGPARSRCD